MQFPLQMSLAALLLISACCLLASQAEASPLRDNNYDLELEPESESYYVQELLQELARKRDHRLMNSYYKRGLDFGMGRGNSGAKAAKQMMGLTFAQDPSGPGRR